MRKVLLLATSLIAVVSSGQTFQNPRLIPTPHAVNTILHGDLNGDGFDDLIYDDFATSPATLHVMLGNGHGGYIPGSTISLPVNTLDNCLLNNFAGSGRLDIACLMQTVSSSSGAIIFAIVFLPGNGDGTFSSAKTLTASSQLYGNSVLMDAGDLNGDGAADLVVEQYASSVGYPVLSDGHGGWTIGGSHNYFTVPSFHGDLNGDGKIDWVFPGPFVALDNGDGTFGAAQNFNPLWYPAYACAAGDLDGDGHADAICSYADTTTGDINGHWSFRFFHGNPDGSLCTCPPVPSTLGMVRMSLKITGRGLPPGTSPISTATEFRTFWDTARTA